MIKYIKKCRNCNNKSIVNLFSLGKLNFSGKFPKYKEKIPFGNLTLVMCKSCKLVQLKEIFNMKYLYNKDYGYRTGINNTMCNHVKNVVRKISKNVKLKKDDNVLDIASNDGTLLNNYNNKIITWGMDPLLDKYKNEYKKINHKISNFFEYRTILKINKKVKFKIITALSVFYDLENPNLFLNSIKKILHQEGIFYLEFQDLMLILKKNMFDTICHEHLEYYSVTFMNKILKKHNLRIFDHSYNNINGGSSSYYICHDNAKYKSNRNKLIKILKQEKKIGIEKISTFKKFKKKINILKKNLVLLIDNLSKKNKTIHGYAASTKGNVLLQYYNLNNDKIKFISDRNPKKDGLFTPGTNIKIISEKKSRKLNPDYYLVLAWHFKKEILKREIKIRKKGTKFIFPLPKIEII
jgi:hypothetical protein